MALALCAVLLSSCGGQKVPVVNRSVQEANALSEQGRWAEALAKYSEPGSGAQWDSLSYRWATVAASRMQSDSLSVDWGLRHSSRGDTLKSRALAQALLRRGLTARRDSLIESDAASFEGSLPQADIRAARARTYAKRGDERLVPLFHRLDDKQLKAALFATYFKLAQGKDSEALIAKECRQQLAADKDDEQALRFLARARYNEAEKLYKKAMDDYNKKKSQAAYAYLSRDLKKVISPIYREARDFFERLAKLQPVDKTNIKYLVNIYRRLDNEEKARQLEKKL